MKTFLRIGYLIGLCGVVIAMCTDTLTVKDEIGLAMTVITCHVSLMTIYYKEDDENDKSGN